MCYSLKQSSTNFILNLITCYILYQQNNREYKIIALFFLFVGFMQLFDVIFWSNQDISNEYSSNMNFIFTKIAMIFNHLQPIILAILIYYYNGYLDILSQYTLFIYTVIIICYTLSIYNTLNYTLVDDTKSLKWEWNGMKNNLIVYSLFLISLSVLVINNFPHPLNKLLFLINNISFIIAFYFYKSSNVGRFWCKIAALVPMIFMFI